MKKWLFCMICLCIPYSITLLFAHPSETGSVTKLEPEAEYIIRKTISELPGQMEAEAIKAQMVLVQTGYYRQRREGRSSKECLTDAKCLTRTQIERFYGAKIWESMYSYYEEVKGMTLMCEGEYIIPAYHLVSAGNTRSGETLSAPENKYLKSVSSRSDIETPDFLWMAEYTYQEFFDIFSTQVNNENMWIEMRDENGYVEKVVVNGTVMTGEEFRRKCKLPSCNMTFQFKTNTICITGKGRGHGYGLSLYGAQRMARDGKTWEEILNYYFSNIVLHSV